MRKMRLLILSCLVLIAGSVPCGAQNSDEESPDSVVVQEQNDPEKVFQVVEKMPEYPGGLKNLLAWLQKNVRYPKQSMKNKVQGRVIVKFVIDKDGKAVEPEIEKSVDPYIDKEAIRLINKMPKWTPGEQKGKPVRVKFTLPIMFRLPSPANK